MHFTLASHRLHTTAQRGRGGGGGGACSNNGCLPEAKRGGGRGGAGRMGVHAPTMAVCVYQRLLSPDDHGKGKQSHIHCI